MTENATSQNPRTQNTQTQITQEPVSTAQKSTAALDATVRTHGANGISDTVYWTGHAIGFVLVVVAAVWIFAAKGPNRQDAVRSLLDDAQKRDAKNSSN